MIPDRSNYETWLIDWLDGSLTAQQTHELMAFLETNPDIREEADSIMLARISSSGNSYNGKEKLLRSPADLSSSHVEYLSAQYLEGDLSAEQEADLRQNIENNKGNRIIFENIQRTRLSAPIVHYRYKNKLKRVSVAARIIRISAIVMSAAAIVVFMLLNHMFIPRPAAEAGSTLAIMTPGTINMTQPIKIKDRDGGQSIPRVIKRAIKTGTVIASSHTLEPIPVQTLNDTIKPVGRIRGPESIAFNSLPLITIPSENNVLPQPASAIDYSGPAYDDERSVFNKFITRTFRGKILKEKKISEEPLKSYELAEAGIEGLNKLLGWQMALVKTNDQSGELKSVYFSSRLLKFNAPVKKSAEPQ